jgi:hypothetical protein
VGAITEDGETVPCRESLVYTWSEDGCFLEGILIQPERPRPGRLPLVWVHGMNGCFYEPQVVAVGRELAELGHTFVCGNNRGHDTGAIMGRRDGRTFLAGAAWELFDQCPYDIAGWLDYAVGLGFSRLALLGHSLGAHKVGYYQARRHDQRVAGLIAASPSRRVALVEPQLRALAESLEAEGRGRELLPGTGDPTTGVGAISAQTYANRARANADVYGFHRAQPALASLACPLLAFYGSEEGEIGGPAELATIRRQAPAGLPVATHVFAGADHLYTGHAAAVAATVAAWLDTLPG